MQALVAIAVKALHAPEDLMVDTETQVEEAMKAAAERVRESASEWEAAQSKASDGGPPDLSFQKLKSPKEHDNAGRGRGGHRGRGGGRGDGPIAIPIHTTNRENAPPNTNWGYFEQPAPGTSDLSPLRGRGTPGHHQQGRGGFEPRGRGRGSNSRVAHAGSPRGRGSVDRRRLEAEEVGAAPVFRTRGRS
jgi:hypothetical protein